VVAARPRSVYGNYSNYLLIFCFKPLSCADYWRKTETFLTRKFINAIKIVFCKSEKS